MKKSVRIEQKKIEMGKRFDGSTISNLICEEV
jgi:hypothetical protein